MNNLEYLIASENKISGVSLSSLTSLKGINVNFNELTSINIDNLTNLRTIFIYSNQLTSLTFNNNSSLESVWCSGNLIASLDLQEATKVLPVFDFFLYRKKIYLIRATNLIKYILLQAIKGVGKQLFLKNKLQESLFQG